jgi:D-alanyl-D-alanine carboxypeptidase
MQVLISALAIWVIGASGCLAASASALAETSAKIDELLRSAFPADAPGAAVLVVQDGKTVLRKGYGMANLELGVPVDSDNVFRICSITKQFTAVAILQLVEAGKVRLDDDIHLYVPDYPTGDTKVTLAQLLQHTAGIPSIGSQSEWAEIWRKDMSVTELLALTKNKPLEFAPGTNFKYSNTGYVLLGAVIEKASGQSYADYIQAHIFAPAGMTSSYYDTASRVIPHRTAGYMRDDKNTAASGLQPGGWTNAPFISMTQPYSAGSVLSTVDDMWKWEQALAAGKLVSPALLTKAYTQAVLPDGRETNYGFGWELGTLGGHPTVEHGGGMPGFSADEMRIPDSDIYIVILANAYNLPVSPRSLVHGIAELMLHVTSSAPTVSPGPLEDYVGQYRVGPGQELVIRIVDGKLVGRMGGERPLRAVDVDTFSTPGNEMRLTFLRNAEHKVDRVLVRPDAPGPGLTWPREGAAKQTMNDER